MTIFRSAPASAQSAPIFRIGSKKYGNFHVVILDHKPIFVDTHYVRGLRTQPCIGTNCKWCQTKTDEGEKTTPQPKRERAYIGVLHAERKLRGVLELTAKAGSDLIEQTKTQSIVGQVIKCGRENANANSSIKLEPTNQHIEIDKLETHRNGWSTIAALCATWGIDDPTIGKLHAPEEFMERGHDQEDIYDRSSSNGKAVTR
jgi:hypothetical protein